MLNIFKSSAQVVEEIHSAIDSAQDKLLSEARSIIDNCKVSTKADRLKNVGFTGIEYVKQNEDNKTVSAKAMEEANLIEYYKRTYPFQKFITEKEMDRICKKYGLIYAPVANYKKDVPEKNLKEIEAVTPLNRYDMPQNKRYSIITARENWWLFPDNTFLSFWHSEWRRMPRRIEGEFGSRFDINRYLQELLKSNITYMVKSSENFIEDRQGLFIAAPKSHFNLDGLKVNGLGAFSFQLVPVKDPIVFRYCKGGIQVISKWGLEAEDPALVNEIYN